MIPERDICQQKVCSEPSSTFYKFSPILNSGNTISLQQFKRFTVFQIMKKGISISLVLLIITAILNFSVASHYCCGKLAASKVSFSGKLADCGMEGTEKQVPPPGTYYSNHCCEDVVTFLGISSNYTPSFSFIPDPFKYNFQVICILPEYKFIQQRFLNRCLQI